MVFIIFLRKGSVRHGIYFEGSAREKRLRNAAPDQNKYETLKTALLGVFGKSQARKDADFLISPA